MIAKYGRSVVIVMSVEETRRELDECNDFLDPNVVEEDGKRLRMPGGGGMRIQHRQADGGKGTTG